VVPPSCQVCGHWIPSGDPSRRVHRGCFRTWPERASLFAAWQSPDPAHENWVNALVHCTSTLGVKLYLHEDVLRDGRRWIDDVLVEVAHAAALQQAQFDLKDWSAWVRCEDPVWPRSIRERQRADDREDLVAFAGALPALRERWPDTAAVLQSPQFEAFAVEVRHRAAGIPARDAEARRWRAEENARVLAWARGVPPCPSCATPGPHRLVHDDDGPLYLTCASCNAWFCRPD
jgi:hypothetical protein